LGDISKLHQDTIVGIKNVLTVHEKLTVNLQRHYAELTNYSVNMQV